MYIYIPVALFRCVDKPNWAMGPMGSWAIPWTYGIVHVVLILDVGIIDVGIIYVGIIDVGII